MNWFSLTKAEQKALAKAAVAERRTLVERWQDMGEKVSPGRDARAAMAAGFIAAGSCVLDLGCGAMMPLERHLPHGTHYVPLDVVRRDERTIVADLNVVPLPYRDVDYVVGLGLLEYLNDVPVLLDQVACYRAVFSYAATDLGKGIRDRAESGWVNGYTVAELSTLFVAAGFHIEQMQPCPGRQMLWMLVPSRNRTSHSQLGETVELRKRDKA